jgi:hypothetical protein
VKVEIYGHSDDCIEVDGDLHEEFTSYNGPSFLHFGDGTVIEAEYGPSNDAGYFWRIRPIKQLSADKCRRVPGTYDGDEGRKCDKLILEGDLKWVECWGSAEGPTEDDCDLFMDKLVDSVVLSTDQVKRIMAIAREGK